MSVVLPPTWVEQISSYPPDGGPSGADWLRTVPRRITEALARWDLVVDGAPRTGWTAIVVPVRRGDEPLALKVTWPHTDGAHEHLALRRWGGEHAVRLAAADPAAGTLLLERLDADRDLNALPLDDACREIGSLLGQLNVPAGEPYAPIGPYLRPHLERMAEREAVPRRIVQRTHGLARELLDQDDDNAKRLLHTDLHFDNVLWRPDGGWVAIDPKPILGPPAFDLLPLLQNRSEELEGRTFREAMRRRIVIAAEAAGPRRRRGLRVVPAPCRDRGQLVGGHGQSRGRDPLRRPDQGPRRLRLRS